ncbi:MAG: extracellular substrate binding-like orphan protein GrrP [Cyanobacteria bacterium]|nr:extracellular substrate binding-like orphan protein GrrP [Cyanobacteriota bacterium]
MPRYPLSRLLPATLSLLAALAPMAQARAEGVVDRVARSGELVLVGIPEVPPLLSLDAKGQPQGYGVAVARQISAELSTAVGRPVTLRFVPVKDGAALGQSIASGKADLACGVPFTWEWDQQLDFSLPIGLSGLRLLAPAGSLDGSPASLSGRRIGVVADSLAATELQGVQPQAIAVPFPSLAAAVAALRAGSVQGVIGDTLLLASLVRAQAGPAFALTPQEPYERFAVACLLPENDSAFRNLVNLAIARLLQGYLDGTPASVAAIDAWIGPGSSINLPADLIRTYFETVLLGVEALRPLPPAAAPAGAPKPGT